MEPDMDKIITEIQELRACADRLKAMGEELPALNRNLVRIMAGIRMLELDFVEPTQL